MKIFPNWVWGGLALASVMVLSVVLVKPIGVSTQYVVAGGIAMDMVNDEVIQASDGSKFGYSSQNAYLDKSGGKYAKAAAEPLNYGMVFIISMIAGGFISSRFKTKKSKQESDCTRQTVPDNTRWLRLLGGGFLALFGARLAGGCTSGHMLSGLMQTSISGYLFAAAVFLTAIPLAIRLYGK